MAQRLVRTLCMGCKKTYQPPKDLIMSIGLTEQEAQGITFYQAIGCDECLNTGYRGRVAIFELMPMSDKLAKLTMERVYAGRIRKQAMAEGMTLLVQDGLHKIKQGITTIEEVLSAATMEFEVVE